jgi:alpha-tubulin suppressor-like RCC1 family protein
MRKLMRVWSAVFALLALTGAAPAAAGPADAGTVASVREAQRRLGPGPLRRPAADDSLSVGGLDPGTVAVGTGHTCVTVLFSYVWCWGANDDGQLGNGTTAGSAEPVTASATGRLRNKLVVGITAGRAHTCVLSLEEEAFGAYCWGANDEGQLGDGSLDAQTRPEQVATGVIGITAGAEHTCVLSIELTVSCWGRNDDGQLGVDTAGAGSPSPQEVPGLTGVVDVAAGRDSTCAVDSDGKAYCWGAITSSVTPVPVSKNGFTRVSTGRAHACGLVGSTLTGGYVYCWGADGAGQLGDGSGTVDSALPVRVAGDRRYVSVSAAGDSTCAVTATGQGYCWGANAGGQLGTGDTEAHTTPVAVDQSRVRIGQVVRQLYGARQSMIVAMAAGPDRSCAVSPDQTTYCTEDGLLTAVPLAPSTPRDVEVRPRDGALEVSWAPPARAGVAPVAGYSAIAVPPDLQQSFGCGGRARSCTIGELRNDRRYSVFVVAVSTGGIAYSSITHASPAGGGGGGGLPITGPHGTLAAALALLCTGLGLLLVARHRHPSR